jgi:LysR family transcriptional regulator (chromosome initiation inhibitor)
MLKGGGMSLVHPQLAAFAAIVEEGSFEAAGRQLCITTSAVSQRIKALEDRLGQVLVVRQLPCRPTPAGALLLRRLLPIQMLEAEALEDFLLLNRQGVTARTITIAVNSDSLATWVLGVLALLNREHGYLFDVRVDDQDHTLKLLRDGSVLGTVTGDALAVQGCEVVPLGAMRYHAIAAPQFEARYFPDGVNAMSLSQAPMIVFDRKDELQWRFVHRITRVKPSPPIHYLPTSTGFVDAAALGLGWCLAPEPLLQSALEKGMVKLICPDSWLDVDLYWQHVAVRSDTLKNISTALTKIASIALYPSSQTTPDGLSEP